MKNFTKKFLSLFLVSIYSLSLYAQNMGNPFFPTYSSSTISSANIQHFEQYLQKKNSLFSQQGLVGLRSDFEADGNVDACRYQEVMENSLYLSELKGEEIEEIVYYGHFLYPYGAENEECTENIKSMVRNFLNSSYDEKSRFFQRDGLMLLIASALARHPAFKWSIENAAFEQVDLAASQPVTSHRARWAAELLYLLAQDPVELDIPVRSLQSRETFERRLEKQIRKFNRIKDYRTDYYVPGVPCTDVLSISNQGALISLFGQVNNYLAMKNDDGILKSMVSTGGLNFIGRGNRPAFSDKGETFYLHHVTPGTDGRGNVVDSYNGQAHLVLHTLLTALFVSYSSRTSTQESSALMRNFIESYLDTDSEGHFASYLYIPMQGMRMAKILGDAYSLDGWEKEEAALQNKLYSILKKGYTGSVICNYVQGSCEVIVEWVGVGKLLGWFFKGSAAVVKGAGKGIVRILPAKTVFYLGITQAVTKHSFQWGKRNIKALLSRYGWKVVATGGAAALLTGDEPLRETVSY